MTSVITGHFELAGCRKMQAFHNSLDPLDPLQPVHPLYIGA